MKSNGVDGGTCLLHQESLEIELLGIPKGCREGGCRSEAAAEVHIVNPMRVQLRQSICDSSMAHGHRHAAIAPMVQDARVVQRQTGDARMPAMAMCAMSRDCPMPSEDVTIGRNSPRSLEAIDRGEEGKIVGMADCVCPWSHRRAGAPGGGGSSSGIRPCHAVLPNTALHGGGAARALAAVTGTRRGRRRLVKLLLVSKKQITPCKAPVAFGTSKGFLLGMRALMSLQVFESRK